MNRFLATVSVAGLLLGSGPSTAWAQSSATLNADRVNVRSRPSQTGEVVTQLRRGQTVVVLEEGLPARGAREAITEWTRIELPAGTPVWVSETHLDAATGEVRPRRLNVRAGPSEDYGVLGTVAQGALLRKLGGGDGWVQIEAPGGLSGFLASKFLDPAPAPPAPEAPAPAPAPTVPEPKPLPPPPAPAAAGGVTPQSLPSPEPPPSTAPPPTQPARPQVASAPASNAPSPAVSAAPVPATPVAPFNATVPSSNPAATLPSPTPPEPPPEPAPPRIVQREGVVSGTLSIQAPTYFELRATDTGRLLNYLWPASTNIDIRPFRGARVRVTGEEAIEPRWPITPLIRVDRIILAP